MKVSYAVKRILDHYPHWKLDDLMEDLHHVSFVNLSRRYLYVLVTKVASTTMMDLLRTVEHFPAVKEYDGTARLTRRDMFSRRRENVPLPSLLDLDDKTQKQVLESPDFLRMTIVRNPYTRLVSAWRQRVLICDPGVVPLYTKIKGHPPELGRKSLVSFEEFVNHIAQTDLRTCDLHWRRQVDHTFIKALRFNHIGKLERMEETVQRFQQHLGLGEPISAGRKNTTDAGNVEFTQSLADKLYSLYREDFETFGYDRNDWPRQPHNGDHSKRMVPEEKYLDEIIERNIVITRLDEQRRQLLRRTPSGLFRRVYDKFHQTLLART